MQEIGLKLRVKREENGVSVEEAAEDLKVRPSQIVNFEEGKKEEFKDILYLKNFIRDYAKYLGMDSEKILDEFNEFMFDYTSKISLADIEKAKNMKNNEEEIISPYTKEVKNDKNYLKYIILIIILILVIIVGVIILDNKNYSSMSNINMIGGNYEYSE